MLNFNIDRCPTSYRLRKRNVDKYATFYRFVTLSFHKRPTLQWFETPIFDKIPTWYRIQTETLRIFVLSIGRKLQTPGFQNFPTSGFIVQILINVFIRIDFKVQILTNALLCIDFKVLNLANSILLIELVYFVYSLFHENCKL